MHTCMCVCACNKRAGLRKCKRERKSAGALLSERRCAYLISQADIKSFPSVHTSPSSSVRQERVTRESETRMNTNESTKEMTAEGSDGIQCNVSYQLYVKTPKTNKGFPTAHHDISQTNQSENPNRMWRTEAVQYGVYTSFGFSILSSAR